MKSYKSLFAKPYAKFIVRKTEKWSKNPVKSQEKVFTDLIKKAENTQFGKDHNFSEIHSISDFQERIPIRGYEELKPYIEKIQSGEANILWPGLPLYFAKTSGTTSGAKFIPLTKESLPEHIKAARNAILHYIYYTGNTRFVEGKMIFLQGSPKLNKVNGINIGRLSGIVAHYVPSYLQKNRLPSFETNCIDDWEDKVEKIIDETLDEPLSIISGIPSWVQMYFEKIVERKNKPISEVFKDFQLFIYGGVNFNPYKQKFEALIGKKINSIELFPASEGFFAYQDCPSEKGLLLLLHSGIFYEFIKASAFSNKNPKRYTIGEVKLGVNYVLIVSTNAGLWAYNVGDTIEFVSLNPYRVIVTGRIKHFISAFGEHVIGKEVDQAMKNTLEKFNAQIIEFTVAPEVNPNKGLPFHEWFVEFDGIPSDLEDFAAYLNQEMVAQNIYYKDLIEGNILTNLKISPIQKDGFKNYMASIGKLGGQNKLPRLSNDRKLASKLNIYKLNN